MFEPSAHNPGAALSEGLLAENVPTARFQEAIAQVLKREGSPCQQAAPLAEALDAYLQHPTPQDPGLLEKYELLTAALARRLGARGQGFMVLAQINPTPGDLAGNAQKIMRYIQAATDIGADAVLFPELALMGYPIRDVIVRHPFLGRECVKWLEALAQRTGETRAVVGFVEPRKLAAYEAGGRLRGKPFYNALAILGAGRIEGIVRKSLLPTYGEFNDLRTFEPSEVSGHLSASVLGSLPPKNAPQGLPSVLHGVRYGLSICEDSWNDSLFFEVPQYAKDPIAELAQHQPKAFLNISASPSRSRKEQLKHTMLSQIARTYGTPYVYVNQVGSVDETSYDGTSRVYDQAGHLVARGKAFQEQFLIVNPLEGDGVIYPLPGELAETLPDSSTAPSVGGGKVFDAFDESDLGRTYETLVQGIRDYFAKSGFSRAVLGISGGIDSAVVAALLVDALGAAQVVGVSLPSRITPEENRSDAQQLADNLGIKLVEIPIASATQAFEQGFTTQQEALEAHWGATVPGSAARENIQARSRAVWIWMIANEFNALPIATSDKSEFYMGYTTVHGDMAGAIAPLGDVPKTKVRRLAHWMNAHRAVKDALPLAVIERPSGADLAVDPATGELVKAEDALMPYEFADEIIWRIEALHQSQAEMEGETFQWERRYGVSPEQKRAWLEKFFRRMATSVFKWWVSPPVIIVEGYGSITKTDYHHPILSSRIRWAGTEADEIGRILNATRDSKKHNAL